MLITISDLKLNNYLVDEVVYVCMCVCVYVYMYVCIDAVLIVSFV
jgi:hypothetical protein